MVRNAAEAECYDGVPRRIGAVALAGILVLTGGVAGFAYWSVTARLDSAVIARGSFVATGKNKVVQHLEGGIVREILIKEGDNVKEDQVVLRLDSTLAKSELERLRLRRLRLMATQARLEAEKLDLREPRMPAELRALLGDSDTAAIVEGAQAEFHARLSRHRTDLAIIEQRISAIHQEIGGLTAQHHSAERQGSLTTQQIEPLERLYADGMARLPQILELKRLKTKLEGDIGDLSARMGQAAQRISELRSQMLGVENKRVETAVSELQSAENELGDVEQRLKSKQDVLVRSEVRAPVTGIVVKLLQHSPSGVVAPGLDIMEILPLGEQLLVEAYVRPEEIEAVRKGNKASLKLMAFKARSMPNLNGEVIYVSADAIASKEKGESFYVTRIKPDAVELSKILTSDVTPGMPVEVFIATGERTFLDYMIAPVRDSFQRSFREH